MAQKTLLIGLGSMGVEIANFTIESIESKFGSLQAVPWLKVFAVDTAMPHATDKVFRSRNFESIGVSENDFQDFKTPGRLPKIDFEHWRDTRPFQTNNSSVAGAGNIRMIGRASMLHPNYFAKVAAGIRVRLESLMSLDLAVAVRTAGLDVDIRQLSNDSINVFVVGSLLGGTCSGSFIDIGYWLRNYARIHSSNQFSFDISGIFSIPHTTYNANGMERRLANVYAALQELNHFMTDGAEYSCTFSDSIHSVEFTGDAPFHSVSLVMPRGSAAEDRKLIHAAAGEIVSIAATSQMVKHQWTKIIDASSNVSVRYHHGVHLRFMSLGLGELIYPSAHIEKACAMRLVANGLDEWLGTGRLSPGDADVLLTTFELNLEPLQKNLLKPELDKTPVKNQITNILADASSDIAANRIEAMSLAKDKIEEGFQTNPPVAGGVGPRAIYQAVDTNVPKVKSDYEDRIFERASRAMVTMGEGPIWCKEFFEATKRRLDHIDTTLGLANNADHIAELERQLLDKENEIKDTSHDGFLSLGFRGYALRKLAKQWEAIAQTYWDVRLNAVANRQVSNSTQSLRVRLDTALDRISGEGNDNSIMTAFQTIRDDAHESADLMAANPPIANGHVVFDSETVAKEYQECLQKVRPEAHPCIAPNRSGEAFATASLIANFAPLQTCFEPDSSPFDRAFVATSPSAEILTETEILMNGLLESARVRFDVDRDVLRLTYGNETTPRTSAAAEIQKVWEASKPFIEVDLVDSHFHNAGEEVGFLNPAFSFSYRAGTAGFPYDNFKQDIGQENHRIPADQQVATLNPSRAAILRAQTGFSAQSIKAVTTYKRCFDHLSSYRHSGQQPGNRSQDATLYSRDDIVWRSLDGSPWHPQWRSGIGAFLYGLAMGYISRSNQPGMEPYILRIPSGDSIRLPNDIELASWRLLNCEAYHFLVERLKQDVSNTSKATTVDKIEEMQRNHSVTFRGLKWRGETNVAVLISDPTEQKVDKTGKVAQGRFSDELVLSFLLEFVQAEAGLDPIAEYWRKYKPLYYAKPERYLRRAGQNSKKLGDKDAPEGYYCDGRIKDQACDQYLGEPDMPESDFPLSCPNCQKALLLPGYFAFASTASPTLPKANDREFSNLKSEPTTTVHELNSEL